MRDLLNFTGLEQVEAGIADMADGDDVFFDEGNGEDASHARPLGMGGGEPPDFIVGEGDGLTETFFGTAGLAFQTLFDDFNGEGGGLLSGGLSTDAIDDGVDTAIGIDVAAVLVMRAFFAGIAGGGPSEMKFYGHFGFSVVLEAR
jgi:hypothetical protein